jgi:hypothetical protein
MINDDTIGMIDLSFLHSFFYLTHLALFTVLKMVFCLLILNFLGLNLIIMIILQCISTSIQE